ncbi:hemolysin family protein [Methylovirgula sp. HY1]|uniref:hemolysin family protein n=1 Tax=Methylovirgula sp. HY1 TaxID=2822761 RepID=UPI001C763D27|nr:hemolysin family protein [Methylovirgula sp. HY1]QXX75925.1 Hemolysin C [Methylovirgula sp. HY1]
MSNDRSGDNDNGHDRQHSRPSLIDRLRSLFGLGGASVRDDIQDALEDTSADPDFSPLERAMLKNVLSLHEVRVEDVMVPRADIFAIGFQSTLAEVLATFRSAGHSRLPVQGENLDDPRGMVHIRDFVDFIAAATDDFKRGAEAQPNHLRLDEMTLAQSGIVRPVLFVPPSMPALDLLVKMQATRTHMALVIDEYGGTDGLASIEDIVEMIVGDIEDEHDDEESPKIEREDEGSFVVDARAGLEDVSEVIGQDLTMITDAEDIDTLGGLITSLAGHVPLRGEIVVEAGLEFEVLDADPRRVKRIRIRHGGARNSAAPGENGDQAAPATAEDHQNKPLLSKGASV